MTTSVAVMSGAAWSAATATRPLLGAPAPSRNINNNNKSCICIGSMGRRRSSLGIRCEVGSGSDSDSDMESMGKVGSKVRVNAPVRVYHVGKKPDMVITPEMEGVIKQYVGFWKGKRISPNYPFKVEFVVDSIKFVAHLREDEFHIISSSS